MKNFWKQSSYLCQKGKVLNSRTTFYSILSRYGVIVTASPSTFLPQIRDFSEIFAEIPDFRRNPRFSPKPEIFAETRDFRQNPKFSSKSEIFAETRDFRQNPKFLPKSEIFAEIRDFRRNPKFSPKSEIFAKCDRWTNVGRPFFDDQFFQKFFKKIQNFNWPGLGPVRAVPSVRAVPPSPGQLKF